MLARHGVSFRYNIATPPVLFFPYSFSVLRTLFILCQVVNPGIPVNLLERMIEAVRAFHQQPAEGKMKNYSTDLGRAIIYEPSSHFHRQVAEHWQDNLRIKHATSSCLPTVLQI
eukprot:Gb_04823 [translate_table: standard]